MAFIELSLASLSDLDDGRVSTAFQQAMARGIKDCMDRPSEKKERVVTLQLNLTPIVGESQGTIECEGAWGEFVISETVPKRKSKPYSLRVNKRGQAAFSSTSPDNADQTTIFDDTDPDGRVQR